MSDKHKHPFQLDGNFVGFAKFEGGRPRRMFLESEGRQVCLKVSKRFMMPYSLRLSAGMKVRVHGIQKWDDGALKKKVLAIQPIDGESTPQVAVSETTGVIQVCSKGNCWRSGGRDIYEALRHAVELEGLEDQVKVETTGCLGNCKLCPNVLFPNGQIEGRVRTRDAMELLQKHFCATAAGDSH